MKKTIAIPYAIIAKGDPDEIAQYGEQPMTAEEVDAREDEEAKEVAQKLANQWRDNRVASYPPITDQIDALMKWIANGDRTEIDLIAARCMEVKTSNPKHDAV